MAVEPEIPEPRAAEGESGESGAQAEPAEPAGSKDDDGAATGSTSAAAPVPPTDGMVVFMWLMSGVFWLSVALPIALLLTAGFALLFSYWTTTLMAHTGGFDVSTYRRSSVAALLLLLVSLIIAGWVAMRRAFQEEAGVRHDPGVLGAPGRHPFRTAGVILLLLAFAMTFVEWDGNPLLPDVIPGSMLLATLGFWTLERLFAMSRGSFAVVRILFRVGLATHYRAGAITAVFVLASGLVVGGVALGSHVFGRLSRDPLFAHSLPSSDPRGLTQHLLCSTAERRDVFRDDAPPSACTYLLPQGIHGGGLGGPGDTGNTGGSSGGLSLEECLEEALRQLTQYRGWLVTAYRLRAEDVDDIVAEAAIETCDRDKRPDDIGRYASRVAKNRAADWKKVQNREQLCDIFYDAPDTSVCDYSVDEKERRLKLQELWERAMCKLSPIEVRVFELYLGEEKVSFRDVGLALDMTERRARDTFYNALRRLQPHLRKSCYLELLD